MPPSRKGRKRYRTSVLRKRNTLTKTSKRAQATQITALAKRQRTLSSQVNRGVQWHWYTNSYLGDVALANDELGIYPLTKISSWSPTFKGLAQSTLTRFNVRSYHIKGALTFAKSDVANGYTWGQFSVVTLRRASARDTYRDTSSMTSMALFVDYVGDASKGFILNPSRYRTHKTFKFRIAPNLANTAPTRNFSCYIKCPKSCRFQATSDANWKADFADEDINLGDRYFVLCMIHRPAGSTAHPDMNMETIIKGNNA